MDKQHIQDIATTIIEQMGGSGRLQAFVGANSFGCDEIEYEGFNQPAVWFKFKMNRTMNVCRVIYEEGKDLYVVQFIKATIKGLKIVKEFTNVYAEDLIPLFENTTGLVLRF